MSQFRSHLKILAWGQVLSLLLAGSGALSSSLYYRCNISVPTTQTAAVFLLMTFHLFLVYHKQRVIKVNHNKAIGRISFTEIKQVSSYDENTGEESDVGQEQKLNQVSSYDENTCEESDVRRVQNDSDASNKGCEKSIYVSSFPSYSLFGFISLHLPVWIYAIIAIIFVEASFFATLALRYTSFFSASILDNVNIFAAMISSRFMLRRIYSWGHIIGAVICCLGTVINVYSDYRTDKDNNNVIGDDIQLDSIEFPNRIFGDSLAVLGGILLGLGDVIIEVVVKSFGSVDEYLGCVGLFGFCVATIQACILERDAVSKMLSSVEISMEEYRGYDNPIDAPRTCSSNTVNVFFITYTVMAYLFISGMSRFLTVSETALLMISALTQDLWAAIFTILAEQITPPIMLYFAFVFVIVGVIVYVTSPSPLETSEEIHVTNDQESRHSKANEEKEIV